jgi:hypothetical protein
VNCELWIVNQESLIVNNQSIDWSINQSNKQTNKQTINQSINQESREMI